MSLAFLFCIALAEAQTSRAPGNDTIQAEQLRADLFYLAGDSLRGRLTGTPEYRITADFIESRFKRLGLKGAGPGGEYNHRFDLVVSRLGEGNKLSVHSGSGASVEGNLRENFHPLIFSGTASAKGNVVFAGYGIQAPALGWDDYKGLSVRGNVVLILDGEPEATNPASRFDGLVTSEHSNILRKAITAQANGAAGLLVVNAGSYSRSYWPEKPAHLERYTLASYADRITIPVIQIAPAVADLLLKERAVAAAGKAEKGQLAEAAGSVEMRASVRRGIVEDRNIIAMVEGTDLKDEVVIVSAHYDHNGAVDDQIFNGADDNGSGVVALLEIAEAYSIAASQNKRPRRTVLLASWGSEERCCGPLLGAWAWVEKPWFPLGKTAAVLNMDMIGRSEEVPVGGGSRFNGLEIQAAAANANAVNVIGTSYSPELGTAIRGANRDTDLTLRMRYDNNRSNLLRRSDQWPFLQRGVAAVFLHTGLHPDYHTVFDRPEKIDYAKVERVAKLVHQASWELANTASKPKFLTSRPIPKPD